MSKRRFFVSIVSVLISMGLIFSCVSDKEANKFVEKLEKKPGEGKPASYWVKKLTDPQLKSDAVKALLELKDKSVVPQLVELFKKDKSLRADIAEIIGAIGDKSAAPTLLEGLVFEVSTNIQEQRENDRINEKILGSLAAMQEESAKPAVIKLLSSTSAPVLAAAVKAERTFKDKAAVDALIAIVRNDNLSKAIRSDAIYVLGEIGDPKAVPALIRAMYVEKQGTVYPEANEALQKIGKPAVPELIKTLLGKNEEVNQLAEKSNFVVGAVEGKAAETLGDICDPSAEDALIKMIKSNEDNPIAKSKAAFALGRMQSKKAAPIMAKLAEDEEDPSVRAHYLLAINLIGDTSVIPQLLKAEKKPDLEKYKKEGATPQELDILRKGREEVVKTIARLATEKDAPHYDKMMKEEKNPEISKVIKDYAVMIDVSKECKSDLACYKGKLSDANKIVREKAAYMIGRIDSEEAVNTLIGLLGVEKDNDVKFAVLQGLFNFSGKYYKQMLPQIEKKVADLKDDILKNDLNRLLLRLKSLNKQ